MARGKNNQNERDKLEHRREIDRIRQRRHRFRKKIEAAEEQLRAIRRERERELAPKKKKIAQQWCRDNGFVVEKWNATADALYVLVAKKSDRRLLVYAHKGPVMVIEKNAETRFREIKKDNGDYAEMHTLEFYESFAKSMKRASFDQRKEVFDAFPYRNRIGSMLALVVADRSSLSKRRRIVARGVLRHLGNFLIDENKPTASVIDAIMRSDFRLKKTSSADDVFSMLLMSLKEYNKFSSTKIELDQVKSDGIQRKIDWLISENKMSAATDSYEPYPIKKIALMFSHAARCGVEVLNYLGLSISLGLRPSEMDRLGPEIFSGGSVRSQELIRKTFKKDGFSDDEIRREQRRKLPPKASVLAFVLADSPRLKSDRDRHRFTKELRKVFESFDWYGARATFLTNQAYLAHEDIRSSFADECRNVRSVSEILRSSGHENSTMLSKHYSSFSPEQMDGAAPSKIFGDGLVLQDANGEDFDVLEWDNLFEALLLRAYLIAVRDISEQLFTEAKSRAIDFLRSRREDRQERNLVPTKM